MYSLVSVFFSLIMFAKTTPQFIPAAPIPAAPNAARFTLEYTPDNNSYVGDIMNGPPEFAEIDLENNVQMRHYIIGQKNGTKLTPNCKDCLKNFLRKTTTVFVVHGFRDSGSGPHAKEHRKAFEKRGAPVNIILVNWENYAKGPFYQNAARNIKQVGKYIAKMIDFLIKVNAVTLKNVIYIGHSLGAQMSNSVSRNLKEGKKLYKIFALDPALPLFKTVYNDKDDRVDPTDADFVLGLHTAAGTVLQGGLGFEDPVGHVDFYPNSGKKQPGCGDLDFGICSHSRAYYLFAESIQSPYAFPSCKCNNWEEYQDGTCDCKDKVMFGWETPETATGVYYFETNAVSPYGIGQPRRKKTP